MIIIRAILLALFGTFREHCEWLLGWPNFDFLAPYRKQNKLTLNVLFWIVSLAKVCPIFKFRTFLES